MRITDRSEIIVGRSPKRWWTAAILLAMFLVVGCSGSTDDDEASRKTKPAKDPTLAKKQPENEELFYKIGPLDSETDQVSANGDADYQQPQEPLDYVAPEALIDQGVEAGVWEESEATIVLLRILIGELPTSTIDVWDSVISDSFSGVAARAVNLLDDTDLAQADRDELERLLLVLAPPIDEVFPDLAESSSSQDAASMGVLRRVSDNKCVTPALESFGDVKARQDVDCWKVISHHTESFGGYQLRVVFPKGLEDAAQVALNAMKATTEAAEEWGAKKADSTLLITPDDHGRSRGIATVNPKNFFSRECAVSVFAGEFGKNLASGTDFEQTVAHEQVHCLQFASFDRLGVPETDWVIEAVAELYSHFVFPENGAEREFINNFIEGSLYKPLDEMSYENWVWWQYLVNQTSAKHVWELQGRLIQGGLSALGQEPDIAEQFQNFTIDLATVGVPTKSQPVPASERTSHRFAIAREGPFELSTEPFVARRMGARWVKEHRFAQQDQTKTVGLMQMAPVSEKMNRSAWRGLPPELRAGCNDDLDYVVAVTTTKDETHTIVFEITEIEKYGCDSCLGGTWLLDNHSFAQMVAATTEAQGGLPAGASFSLELFGDYFIRFDGEGDAISWRNGYEIRTSSSQGGFDQVISHFMDSIETLSYGADGERFTAWDSVIVDYRSSMQINGAQVATSSPDKATISMFGISGDAPGVEIDDAASGAGGYVCDKTTLEITWDGSDGVPVRWNRVKDIPEPPMVLPPPE